MCVWVSMRVVWGVGSNVWGVDGWEGGMACAKTCLSVAHTKVCSLSSLAHKPSTLLVLSLPALLLFFHTKSVLIGG